METKLPLVLRASQYVSQRARRKRFERFVELGNTLRLPIRILDVGGTNDFWESCGWAGKQGVHITLLNLYPMDSIHENVECRVGDATDLSQFKDQSFDIVFSNSVIEHLLSPARQLLMANEIRRVGRAYWVQTPNYWFPVEPHFHMLGWQWMPEWMRVEILRRRRCGWVEKTPDPVDALDKVRRTLLLSRRELAHLFPDARLEGERMGGLVKSWIAVRGLPAAS